MSFLPISHQTKGRAMNRDDLAGYVLMELEKQCAAVRARERPPKWQTWSLERYEDDLEFGPPYTPLWFGAVTATDAGRVRVLRTVYRLAAAGLLEIMKSPGNRLERVKLTPAGVEA